MATGEEFLESTKNASGNAALPRLNVLVVDDDEAMRALLKLHLSNAGYCVALAEDALVAGRRILNWTPDLLIVDIDMPYMNGIDFVATLLADATIPYIPVIFVTAHEDYAPKAQALGADVIVKPFFKDRLLESVARNIAKHHGREAPARPEVRPVA